MIGRSVNLLVLGFCAVAAVHAAPAPAPAPTAAPAAVAGPAPHIKFDAAAVNLGDVVHGQDAVATFTYHSTGDAPLHILQAKPS